VRRLAITEGKETEFLASYIRTEATQAKKLLVYVPFVKIANNLGTALNCAVYHRQIDMEDRKASQISFSSYSTGVLVATTAFLVGIYISNIDSVL